MTALETLFAGLRQRRQQLADSLEELGSRIAHGEHVTPDEAQAFLDHAQATEADLAPVVARHQDRLRLKQRIADGHAAEKKLAKIDKKLGEANAAVSVAVAARDKLQNLTWEESILLRQTVQRGRAAVDDLLGDDVLSPHDVAQLAQARDAAIAANQQVADHQRQGRELAEQLADAELQVEDLAAASRQHKRCEATGEAYQRAKNRLARLRQEAKDAAAQLPNLQRAAEASDAALGKVECALRAL